MGSADVKVNITTWFDDKGLTRAERDIRRAYTMQSQAAKQMAQAEAAAAAQRTQAMHTVSNALGALGLAMTAAAALAIATSAKFDAAMSSVAATGVGSLDALREAAMQAGRDTAYSAIEAAQGIEQLAKAGVSANDILAGGLTATLDLAAAGQLEVAAASEITAATLKQFGLAGADATRVADALAAGANKALGGVEDLAGGLQYVGPVAASLGVSMEEATGALAMFAEQGILGEKAGTGLRGVLMSLTAPTTQAKQAMEQYGISVFDAQGKFIGLAGLAGQLQEGLAGLDDETRQAALGQMFGNAQITAANILYSEGAGAVDDWTAAVSESGYAAEMAAAQLDNLQGDLQILRGSLETALISLGDAGQGPLREVTQSLTGIVNAFAGMPPVIQGTLLAIIGGGGLVALGAAGLMKLTTSIAETKAAMEALHVMTGRTGLAIRALGSTVAIAAVAAVAVAVSEMAGAATVAKVDVEDLAAEIAELRDAASQAGPALADLFEDRMAQEWLPWVDGVESAEDAITSFATAAREAMGENFWDQVDRFMDFGADAGRFAEQVRILDEAFAAMVAGGQVQEAARWFEEFTAAAEAQGVPLDALREMFPEYAAALGEAASAAEGTADAADAATEAIEDQEAAVKALMEALDALNGKRVSAIEADIEWERTLRETAEAIAANEEAGLRNADALNVTTEAGAANMEQMLALRDAAAQRAEAILDETGNEALFRASLADSRQALANTAQSFGLSEEAAWELVDSILAVPPTTYTAATFNTSAAMAAADALLQKLASINGKTVYTYVNTVYSSTTGAQVSAAQLSMRAQADGSVMEFYGGGGLRERQHVAEIAPAGAMRVWAEPETGGEAYIPLAPAKRARSLAIWEETGRRLGADVGASVDPEAIGEAVARHMVGVTVELSNMRAMADTISGQIVRVHDRGI